MTHGVLARALMAGVLTAACGGNAGPVSTRTDSAGVAIVQYDGPDIPLSWSFDSLFSLGGADSGLASFYRLRGGGVGADRAGNIFVLDETAKRIAVFDSLGRGVRAMGGPGGGPGEMSMPLALVVTPDGRAAAFDVAKRVLVWFGPDGEILDQEPSAGYGGGVGVHSSGTALTFPSFVRDPARSLVTSRLVRVARGDTTVLVSQTHSDWKLVFLKSCGIGLPEMPPVFDPTIRWAAAGERVAVATTAAYDVWLFAGAATTAAIRRGISPERATAGAAQAELGPGMTFTTSAGKRTCDSEEALEQRGYAEWIPVIVGIAAGPDGTWWVHRRAGNGALALDVFGAEGDYIGSLPASAPFPVVSLPGRRFGSIVTDELDVDRLVIYGLSTGGGRSSH